MALFLDIAGDYLRDGYKRVREEYRFSDDFSYTPAVGSVQLAESAEPVPRVQNTDSLETIAAEIRGCSRCGLHAPRAQAVPGEGVKRPLAMVIGDAPDGGDTAAGRPFSGEAGALLDKMLGSVRLFRERNCFITNLAKCSPPGDRDVLPDEAAVCAEYLIRQMNRLKPAVILSLGRISARFFLNTGEEFGKIRGVFAEYRGFPLLATYHPRDLLADGDLKRPVWEDLKALRSKLMELDEHYALEIREGG